MRCEQARQLFDAYLDGELTGSLAAELGAHRVQCAECRRSLALLEVSGHLISSDRDPVTLRAGFSDRLLACVDPRRRKRIERLRRGLYVAGPLAAAAMIALAFLGLFDGRGKSEVAGLRVGPADPTPLTKPVSSSSESRGADTSVSDVDDRALDEWIEQATRNVAATRQSGESLQRMLDLTILQVLDALETDAPPQEDPTLVDEETVRRGDRPVAPPSLDSIEAEDPPLSEDAELVGDPALFDDPVPRDDMTLSGEGMLPDEEPAIDEGTAAPDESPLGDDDLLPPEESLPFDESELTDEPSEVDRSAPQGDSILSDDVDADAEAVPDEDEDVGDR